MIAVMVLYYLGISTSGAGMYCFGFSRYSFSCGLGNVCSRYRSRSRVLKETIAKKITSVDDPSEFVCVTLTFRVVYDFPVRRDSTWYTSCCWCAPRIRNVP